MSISLQVEMTGRKLMLTGLAGVCVSLYGVYVERQKKAHGDVYAALCDTERFSCSKARDSEALGSCSDRLTLSV